MSRDKLIRVCCHKLIGYPPGIDSFPGEMVNVTLATLPGTGDKKCKGDSTDTWTDRDVMISAVEEFCEGMNPVAFDETALGNTMLNF